jgi:hypothetical protein
MLGRRSVVRRVPETKVVPLVLHYVCRLILLYTVRQLWGRSSSAACRLAMRGTASEDGRLERRNGYFGCSRIHFCSSSHFAMSLSMNWANSVGLSAMVTKPCSASIF